MNNTGAGKLLATDTVVSSQRGKLLATTLVPQSTSSHCMTKSKCAAVHYRDRLRRGPALGPRSRSSFILGWACSNGPQFLLLANCIYFYLLFGIKWYYLFPMALFQFLKKKFFYSFDDKMAVIYA
jgi:hypothetical protein